MIRFGSFQIDPRTWLLTRDGSAVDLSPRLVEILGYIVRRGGEIVTKDELLERFWPDVNVTENTLTPRRRGSCRPRLDGAIGLSRVRRVRQVRRVRIRSRTG